MDASLLDLFLIAASPFVGSFITAAANSWPDWSKVGFTRSACAGCGRTLGPRDLVPVISYTLQRGRCRTCSEPIWWGHPVGETACLAVALLAVLAAPDPVSTVFAILLGWTLVFASLVDLRTFLLPDVATLGLIPAGFVAAWLQAGPGDGLSALTGPAIGAAIGFGLFAGIAVLYRRLRGRDGLGMGDAKLLAAAGAWTGPFALAWVVAGGAMLTLAALLGRRLAGEEVGRHTVAPFGPGLAAATFAAHLAALSGIGPLGGIL